MAHRIQLRRGTASQWTSANPVLAVGEPGVETDTGKVKYGDGSTAWTSLPYGGGPSAVSSVVGQTGTVTGTQIVADSTVAAALNAKASLASPALTGTPTAPTPTAGTNTTQIATTAFVSTAVAGVSGGTQFTSVLGKTTGTVTGSDVIADSTVTTALAGKAQVLTRTAVKTSAYTAAAGDFVPVDTTAGAVTVTLPTTPADKSRLGVKHIIQGSTNTVTVACGGSDVLNKAAGSTSATLTLANQGATFEYQASTGIWSVTSSDLPLTALDARFLQSGGSNTWTGTQNFSGAAFIGPWQYSLAAVGDYIETGALTNTQNQLAEGVEIATPFWVPTNVTIDRIGMFLGVTLGSTGAVVRVGIRSLNATTPSQPGALLLDAGTFDATTSASTLKTVTVNQTLSAGIYWFTSTTQGGATTRPGLCALAYPIVRAPGTSFTNAKYNIGTIGPTGTTGALNTSYGTPTGRTDGGSAPWFAIRRSA
jgi:hypothetical protein